MDRLTAMQVFVEVAQRGSLTAAAEQLELSRAMVTRYVAELERWLGTRLLQRTTRRLSLTDAGEACLQRCRQMLELADDVEQVAGQRDSEPRGLIRVTTSSSFGQAQLAPAVAAYLRLYPHTRVDLLMVDRTVNLVEERIDLAVRITNELDPALIARRLSVCRSVLCATPAYLAQHGRPATPDALAEHSCLTYSYFGKSQWRLRRGQDETLVSVEGKLSANEATVLLQATLADAGIAMQPTYLVAPLLKNGTLMRVLPDWQPITMSIYGVYASRRHVPATLRTLLDFLVHRFGPEPDWDRL